MKNSIRNGVLMLLIVLTGSCNKSGLFNCFEGSGDVITENRFPGFFDEINLTDNVSLELEMDTAVRVSVTAGENIIPSITTGVRDGILYITNESSCLWAKDQDVPVIVKVAHSDLKRIYYTGYGNISSQDTLRYDSFVIETWGGAGSINLCMDSRETYFKISLGTVDFVITGTTDFNYLYNSEFGRIDCLGLIAEKATVISKGTGDCLVSAQDQLNVTIEYLGDVYYKGDSCIITSEITGAGELIKLD